MSIGICVVTNGAMRFWCVVPFGTTHFLFKEENPMKRTITSIFVIMLALAMMLSLAACGGNGEQSANEETTVSKLDANNAISETPKHIYEDCEANFAKAKQNTYLMKCVVKEISDTDFGCGWNIRVCLPTDELVKLNKDDEIVVIGKITKKGMMIILLVKLKYMMVRFLILK